MKSLKLLVLFIAVLALLAITNESYSRFRSKSYSFARVRTVPGATSDQKKKENEHSTAPKQESKASSKENTGFFCSETSGLKTRLAVSNGGAPK